MVGLWLPRPVNQFYAAFAYRLGLKGVSGERFRKHIAQSAHVAKGALDRGRIATTVVADVPMSVRVHI